jgi:hypothetical protein
MTFTDEARQRLAVWCEAVISLPLSTARNPRSLCLRLDPRSPHFFPHARPAGAHQHRVPAGQSYLPRGSTLGVSPAPPRPYNTGIAVQDIC